VRRSRTTVEDIHIAATSGSVKRSIKVISR